MDRAQLGGSLFGSYYFFIKFDKHNTSLQLH
jgi:hypothetical protein